MAIPARLWLRRTAATINGTRYTGRSKRRIKSSVAPSLTPVPQRLSNDP